MSEELDALELFNSYKWEILSWVQISEEELNVIEQALEQAQENKAMLDIFKSALTIEHHSSTPSFTPLEKDKTFDINATITETIKIKQNDLDEKLRKSLREWVLKNAFPKELKALEIIKVLFNGRAKLYERNDAVQQIVDENGNYNKAITSVYILEFYIDDLHYEFHLHKDEYDALRKVWL